MKNRNCKVVNFEIREHESQGWLQRLQRKYERDNATQAYLSRKGERNNAKGAGTCSVTGVRVTYTDRSNRLVR